MIKFRKYRWSDNDRYWGPFTYARDPHHSRIGVIYSSAKESRANRLRLHLFSHTLILSLPQFIKPFSRWVDTSQYAWSTNPAGGYRDYYRREYGFSTFGGALHYYYGEQTHEWPGCKSGIWRFPWHEYNQIRHSIYDIDGEHFADMPRGRWTQNHSRAEDALKQACPIVKFNFADFDGEEIIATCRIEEWEWTRGKGLFRLIFLGRNRVLRSLDLQFSAEVGKRKGSWKGGTTGYSIDMLPDENIESAFRRHCLKNGLIFFGKIEA